MYSIPVKSAQKFAGKLLVRVCIYLGEIIRHRPGFKVVNRLWIRLFICITVP